MKESKSQPFSSSLLRLITAPVGVLSDVELRLIRIASELLLGMTIQIRCDGLKPGQEPKALDGYVIGRAAELAIAAAISMEKPLRDLRDNLTDPELTG